MDAFLRGCLQAALSVAVMFAAYVLHSWGHPYMHRDNVPQRFFDIVNTELGLKSKVCSLIGCV